MQTAASQQARTLLAAVLAEVRKAVVGKDLVLTKVMAAFLAGGHVLMEDMPGVGKTTLAIAFSKALGLSCRRVQFTPDVMPSDLTGFSMYEKQSGKFVFQPGALFCNLLLADEINRTSSKTQAALLEAMEEGNVTVEGKTYPLPKPHLVIATQNPLGCAGTQSLPESQMDRFLIRLHMDYPQLKEEVAILRGKAMQNPLNAVRPVITAEQLMALQQKTAEIYVDDRLYYYVASIAKATREHPQIILGVSPRGTLALISCAKAMALLRGRDYLLPDDIAPLCQDVLAHRMCMRSGASAEQVLSEILQKVPVPTPERR
ncbi:MAG: MoxR family ATPase [Ruminococcus sp.]|nr:MoxR family ATPase [Ruminococcus sp.]